MPKVLVVSHDLVQQRMAGPGIRSFELSRELSRAGLEVTLAAPSRTDITDAPFAIAGYDGARLRELVDAHDVIVVQGWLTHLHPFLRDPAKRLVVDLYDPLHLENLALIESLPPAEQRERHLSAVRLVNDQLRDGDFFLCAGESQRDFWLGALTALGRVNPVTYGADASLRSLIDVVGFGLPAQPPRKQRSVLRGVVPGIESGDLVLLWGGGIYEWFDPLTLVRAVALAAQRHPRLRLVFHAGRHPHPESAVMAMPDRVRRLSEELGLTGRHVFFNETWVPYEERGDWLLESDVGVSTHLDTVEARFAYRTRVLDYLWAGLPVLLTAGDALATRVEHDGLGIAVPPGDVEAIAAAIDGLADPETRSAYSTRVRVAARSMTWETVAAPLVRYCSDPAPAPDRASGDRAWRQVPISLSPGETVDDALGVSAGDQAAAAISTNRKRLQGWLRRQYARRARP